MLKCYYVVIKKFHIKNRVVKDLFNNWILGSVIIYIKKKKNSNYSWVDFESTQLTHHIVPSQI